METQMETQETYKSLDEFIKKFTANFNVVPMEVTNLWNSIINYADALGECRGEGNSGEFTDEKEEKRLGKELEEKTELLIKQFSNYTGYKPIFVENNQYPIYIEYSHSNILGTDYAGAWDFEKVNS